MSTANRLKNRKKQAQKVEQKQQQQEQNPFIQGQKMHKKIKNQTMAKYSIQQQNLYMKYYQIAECNPVGVSRMLKVFPYNYQMYMKCNLPAGFAFSPLLFLQNDTKIMQKSADRIPRCIKCRTYMNCYNKVQKNYITCFFCGDQMPITKQYNHNQLPNDQINSSIYQAIGPTNFYQNSPPEQTFIFFIDICSQSANTKMLYYAIAAMKQVLSRSQFDDTCIYLYTYDEILHEYDFSGQQIRCTIIDKTIQNEIKEIKIETYFLKDIRNKLFYVLDQLEDISRQNYRKQSNFSGCFQYVFNCFKCTGGKFFIFQCNQAITGEQIFWEDLGKKDQINQIVNQKKYKSLFQSKNKIFFNKYIQKCLKYQCSFSMYCFARNFKNLRVLHDIFKLTNSQLKVYSKDSLSELERFYYQFSYLLGASYYRNVSSQLLIGQGWQFVGIYGNFYRCKQLLALKLNTLEESKKIYAMVAPQQCNNQSYKNPYCAIQVITNYRYRRQSYICIGNIIAPITNNIQKVFGNINLQHAITSIAKRFMSSVRMEIIGMARKKLMFITQCTYLSAMEIYQKQNDIPQEIITLVTAVLGMLKAPSSQPEFINNTPILDKVICQRNFLQFAGQVETSIFFNPYLFDLSQMSDQMCCQEPEFIYPPRIQPRFKNMKNGLFLLDNGLCLYLYISKQCNGELLTQVFGKQKFARNDPLNEQSLSKVESRKNKQIKTLIQYLRQQKSFGWIPLYIIKSGENTINEKNFYLNFYQENYSQFSTYKMSIDQFINIIAKRNSVDCYM